MSPAHPRRIRWLLTAATIGPILVLAGLALQMLRQERDTEVQRRAQALSIVAGRVALDLERQLQDIEARLAMGDGLVLEADGPISSPQFPLLYRGSVAFFGDDSTPELRAAERLEQQQGRHTEAVTAFRTLTKSRDVTVRAAAWLGLGRVLRKHNDRLGALKAFDELAALGTTSVAGAPAALAGRHARALMLEDAGDRDALRREAATLERLLASGGWPIDRAAFEEYQDLLQRWGGPRLSAASVDRTEGAVQLWQRWRSGDLPPRGRRVLSDGSRARLAIWRAPIHKRPDRAPG